MIYLYAFSSPRITGPEQSSSRQVLAQPRRLALLTYLALVRPYGPQPREVLLPLLWPESDAQRARDSLRQALRSLRQSLGAEVLISHGSVSVEIAEGRLWCDVREFERRLDAGEREEALALYGGDLLSGFYPSGVSPEFEHWLEQERARLKRRAAETARELSAEGEARGDLAEAARWARREAEIDPVDEGALRRLMELLVRAGDAADAVGEYERFARLLESGFGDAPSARTQALAEDARRALDEGTPEEGHPSQLPAPSPLDDGREIPTPQGAGPASEISGVRVEEHGENTIRGSVRRPRSARPIAAVLLLPLLVIAGLAARGGSSSPAPAVNGAVAVFPFRTGGAESELAFLHEGMVDLLSSRLTGGEIPYAISPAAVLRAWRRSGAEAPDGSLVDARAVAVEVGAGAAIVGEIVGTRERLHLSASLFTVPDGRMLAEASATGPADSLATLVDALVVELMLRRAGTPEHRLTRSPRTALPALQAFLKGEASYRAEKYSEAAQDYREALAIDSTFVPATLGALSALRWMGDSRAMQQVASTALRMRDHLSPGDRALLDALVSGHYPTPQRQVDQIAAWEQVTRAQPTNAEAWYWYGDHLYHWGPALGLPDARNRARGAFERAIALDSGFAAPLSHLVDLLAERGETSHARRVYEIYARKAPSGQVREYQDWLFAALEHGSDPDVRRRLERLSPAYLSILVGTAQLRGIAPVDAALAIQKLNHTADLGGSEAVVFTRLYHAALNRGRPSEVRRIAGRVQTWQPRRISHLQMPVMAALYSDGDSAYAVRAVEELSRMEARALSVRHPLTPQERGAICTAEQWRLRHGDTRSAARAIRVLLAEPTGTEHPFDVGHRRGCGLYLSALLHIADGEPERALPILEELSGDLNDGFYGWWEMSHLPNLVLAEAYESLGRPEIALEALRRRPYHSQFGIGYLSTFLLREARLAAKSGDTTGAARAYEHYLALRDDPEPRITARVAAVRGELARLRSTHSDRGSTGRPRSARPHHGEAAE